ncbi:MAG: cysteine desulfurase [Gemmatimonadales bacterium]|uniref:cysteine desulfurase family protein n=1 Tax=Candidatus Palauibacter polyketidifaciens TaxID=3056740 RepID=UPI0013846ACB|nr:cysteine desulfurase family protein [Candidatus Palauibacter polyketidifaciens]MXX67367.1 cysteine desulfurase [Gemmatimonadales bacterium]MDE2721429.1 cysteine desulfurase family protein [Candidatus Palauibacter polyketidifaciens]MYG19501.1 cysteine desulfurase [Gemmatimonadales bacterium]MYH10080.1 cysteine desulfurase [Gemmatimonadales bacterium]MYL05616.1 cysteine desulfurase [Gemmatimonadales bacterium]
MTQREEERLYLDYAATWPMRPEVWEAMGAELRHGFNPASAHAPGRRAHRCLEVARGRIADLLGCARSSIYFTGGGTQSDNLAILGFVRSNPGRSPRVFVSEIEHKACLEAGDRGAVEGARVARIPVDGSGTIDLGWLRRELAADPDAPTLISVMWANNEIGTVQAMGEIVELGHEYGALVHTDAVQALGKVDCDLERTPVDLLSATAHKLGGPVGIGLLYLRPGVTLEPLSYGGGQERSMWPGTQNPIGATGFAAALALALEDREAEVARWTALRDHLEARIRAEIPDARIHAGDAPLRMPNLVSIGIPGCDSGAVLVSLDFEGIAASGGSACGSDSSVGSDVLDAIGITSDVPYAAVRFSFGHDTSRADVDAAADALARVAARVVAITA